ncbi:DNA polymerase subunit Cdc27 [Scheffersomyces xylosifermentans]|uniref:DNA polymerase subunit Cdc27 n=1 Tax=Scheffersomyces xylosifermentans TaxID=1304137 RepID=UPI00315D1616
MTMSASQREVEYLATQIIKEEKPVTLQSFSRELDVHVHHSKEVLLEYYQKNKDKVTASFIITGKSSKGIVVKLSHSESDLEQDLANFTEIHTIHVYCLHLKKISLTNSELAFEELKHPVDASRREEYFKNGLIKGPVVKAVKLQPGAQPIAKRDAPARTSTKAATPPVEAKPVKSAGLTSSYVSRKQNNDKGTGKVNTLSNYTSRKGEAKTIPTKRASEESSTGYQYKSRKQDAKQPKERIIVSNSNDIEEDFEMEDEDSVPAKPIKSNSTDLEKLFDDDNFSDIDVDEKEKTEEPATVIEEQSTKETKESEDVSSKAISEEPVQTITETASEEPEEETIQEIDEDGYITTIKKSNAPPKPSRPAARAKPAAETKVAPKKKTDGKKKQSSLMNFFPKK